MLDMIVCDWNRTLYPDLFEEGYFGGLCHRLFLRALWQADLDKAFELGRMGVECYRLFYRAWADRGRALECVAAITELINRHAIAGLPVDYVEQFTRRYARRAVGRIDRRLLEPVCEARRRHGCRLAVISSGSRLGIEQALAEAGCPFGIVLANDFRLRGRTVEALELSIMSNKAEVLAALLSREGAEPRKVMYVGDSRPDAACFEQVGWPVVSFMARPSDRRRFAAEYGAFAPASEAELREHLRRACASNDVRSSISKGARK